MPTGKLLPLSALSERLVHRAILQLPNRPTILADVEIGGPQDSADRRLVLDVEQLEYLLARARASATGRVVVHKFGLRCQLLQEDNGHRWNNCYLIGEVAPEVAASMTFEGAGGFDAQAFRRG